MSRTLENPRVTSFEPGFCSCASNCHCSVPRHPQRRLDRSPGAAAAGTHRVRARGCGAAPAAEKGAAPVPAENGGRGDAW